MYDENLLKDKVLLVDWINKQYSLVKTTKQKVVDVLTDYSATESVTEFPCLGAFTTRERADHLIKELGMLVDHYTDKFSENDVDSAEAKEAYCKINHLTNQCMQFLIGTESTTEYFLNSQKAISELVYKYGNTNPIYVAAEEALMESVGTECANEDDEDDENDTVFDAFLDKVDQVMDNIGNGDTDVNVASEAYSDINKIMTLAQESFTGVDNPEDEDAALDTFLQKVDNLIDNIDTEFEGESSQETHTESKAVASEGLSNELLESISNVASRGVADAFTAFIMPVDSDSLRETLEEVSDNIATEGYGFTGTKDDHYYGFLVSDFIDGLDESDVATEGIFKTIGKLKDKVVDTAYKAKDTRKDYIKTSNNTAEKYIDELTKDKELAKGYIDRIKDAIDNVGSDSVGMQMKAYREAKAAIVGSTGIKKGIKMGTTALTGSGNNIITRLDIINFSIRQIQNALSDRTAMGKTDIDKNYKEGKKAYNEIVRISTKLVAALQDACKTKLDDIKQNGTRASNKIDNWKAEVSELEDKLQYLDKGTRAYDNISLKIKKLKHKIGSTSEVHKDDNSLYQAKEMQKKKNRYQDLKKKMDEAEALIKTIQGKLNSLKKKSGVSGNLITQTETDLEAAQKAYETIKKSYNNFVKNNPSVATASFGRLAYDINEDTLITACEALYTDPNKWTDAMRDAYCEVYPATEEYQIYLAMESFREELDKFNTNAKAKAIKIGASLKNTAKDPMKLLITFISLVESFFESMQKKFEKKAVPTELVQPLLDIIAAYNVAFTKFVRDVSDDINADTIANAGAKFTETINSINTNIDNTQNNIAEALATVVQMNMQSMIDSVNSASNGHFAPVEVCDGIVKLAPSKMGTNQVIREFNKAKHIYRLMKSKLESIAKQKSIGDSPDAKAELEMIISQSTRCFMKIEALYDYATNDFREDAVLEYSDGSTGPVGKLTVGRNGYITNKQVFNAIKQKFNGMPNAATASYATEAINMKAALDKIAGKMRDVNTFTVKNAVVTIISLIEGFIESLIMKIKGTPIPVELSEWVKDGLDKYNKGIVQYITSLVNKKWSASHADYENLKVTIKTIENRLNVLNRTFTDDFNNDTPHVVLTSKDRGYTATIQALTKTKRLASSIKGRLNSLKEESFKDLDENEIKKIHSEVNEIAELSATLTAHVVQLFEYVKTYVTVEGGGSTDEMAMFGAEANERKNNGYGMVAPE